MEETRNWLEMSSEIMGEMILQRLGAVEILTSAQKVCTTWRRICKDPTMWKIIDMHQSDDDCGTRFNSCSMEKLTKEAAHRSCGELIDISLYVFCTDHLLDYILRCSSKLNRLHLENCYRITGCGINNALKRLPHLETLELSDISLCEKDIEVIGRNCPQLKSFKMETDFMESDREVHAIANSMPALRHLKLVGSTIDNDDEIKAILNGCPHLESLELRGCLYLHLDGNLEKLCRERIKDFKFDMKTEIDYWYNYNGRDRDVPDDDGFSDGYDYY